MAQHLLKYGELEWSVDVNPARLVAVLEPNPIPLPSVTAEQAVRQALDAPIQSPPAERAG